MPATMSSTLVLTPIRATARAATVPALARTAAAIHGYYRASRRPLAPATDIAVIAAPAARPRAKPSMQADTTIAMARGNSIRPASIDAPVLAGTAAQRIMIMPATA